MKRLPLFACLHRFPFLEQCVVALGTLALLFFAFVCLSNPTDAHHFIGKVPRHELTLYGFAAGVLGLIGTFFWVSYCPKPRHQG